MVELKTNSQNKGYDILLDYKIDNVVATVSLEISEKINLVQIAHKFDDVEYNPERFPGLIMRLDKPRATFLIFSTGNMVVTGLQNTSNAQKAVQKAIKRMQKIGIKLPSPKIKIRNLVASGDLHTFIDLNKAVITMDYAMYEPEIFPGLIYRMIDLKTVFLIFSTGKIVCTGAKDEKQIKESVLKLNKLVRELKVVSDPPEESEDFKIKFL